MQDDGSPGGGRRLRRAVLRLGAVGVLAVVVLAGWLWATTDLPPAETVQPPRPSELRYADGSVLAVVGTENRTSVPLEAVSLPLQHAVLAAEDRRFYEERGLSPRGIVRAAWRNLSDGEVREGGSTITQQYARAAYLSPERTWSRKLREAVVALKLERELSKEEILERYLDVAYFGRGAHGVEAAAQTYFGRPAAEIDAAQGAVLAALLRSPQGYDPETAPGPARERWRYVLDGMAEQGWLETSPDAVAYPEVLPRATPTDRLGGPTGYLVQTVLDELTTRGFRRESVEEGGLVVTTTYDARAQDAAVRAVEGTVGADLPAGVYAALVSVEPGTGAVRAEYGGPDYVRRPLNAATQGRAQAGSSFKPYVLAAALDRGVPLSTEFDGSSPQLFDDYRVRNFAGASYGRVDLVTATAKSINTVYVPLGLRAGPERVARTAEDLGITSDLSLERDAPSISLGVSAVTPLEQANAFATLAAGGVRAEPFVVAQVADRDGTVFYAHEPVVERVIDEQVAADVTFALQQVVAPGGTGRAARVPGRPVAGKTGTTSENTAAWFVGYTPQLSTAVAVYSERQDVPLRGFAGVREVTGGTLPARAFGRFTAAALDGAPVQPFPPRATAGPPPPPPPPPPPTLPPLPPRNDPGPREVPPPREPEPAPDVQAAR